MTPSQTACGGAPIGTYNTLAACEYEPIIYYALDRLNVTLSAFTPAATAETFSNGVGKIEFVENVTAIGTHAFSGMTAMTRIELPDSVTNINLGAFTHCTSLTSITIPDSVTTISIGAFNQCSGLTSVTIGSGVTSIGSNFQSCTALTSFTCLATTPPSLVRRALNNSDCPIYVPSESVDTYKAKSVWSDYADRIQAIP